MYRMASGYATVTIIVTVLCRSHLKVSAVVTPTALLMAHQ